MQRLEFDKKGKQYGSNVSFSQRHTNKVWKPNP
jgi:ribosomal protein L28